jgi:hypothetical protein
MKDGVFLVVVGVIVIGGIVMWRSQGDLFHLLQPSSPSAQSPVQQPEPPAKPSPTAKSKRESVPVQARVVEEPKVAEPSLAALEGPPAKPASPPVPPPFPSVDQVATGEQGRTITERFGDPAIATLTTDGGHLVENLVYARQRGREATVIRLEDGKVSEAYSQETGPPPTGVSVPRRWQAK